RMGFDPSHDANNALLVAVESDDTDVVRLLLTDKRVDPSKQDSKEETGLVTVAAIHNHIEIVDIFLKDGRADPSHKDNQALAEAAENDNYDIFLRLLQDPRISPN